MSKVRMYRFSYMDAGLPVVQAIDGEVRGEALFFPAVGGEISTPLSRVFVSVEAAIEAEKEAVRERMRRHQEVHMRNMRILDRRLSSLQGVLPRVGTYEELNKGR